MRIILYTGKGGVGKTSVAAASALKCAEDGLKTLIVSTDAAHSLGDSLDISLPSELMQVNENLWAHEIDMFHEVEKSWGKIQSYITTLFTSKSVRDITTEELTIFPGIEDLLSLLRILTYYKDNLFDVIIIDSAPTGETLALLSFPEMFSWWMEKLFPMKRKALKLLRPIAQPLLKTPLPNDSVMSEFENVFNEMDEMRKILSDREITSIRIVVNPEKMVVKEAQRSFTYLNLYDYNVDAIIVNRVIPDVVEDGYFHVWRDIQSKYLQQIEKSFTPVPIYYSTWFEKEVVGQAMLKRMGDAIFKKEDPSEMKYNVRTQSIKKVDGDTILSLYMPFIKKEGISLNQKGDELIIKVGNVKRHITLPRTLLNLNIIGAKLEEDILNITFGDERNE